MFSLFIFRKPGFVALTGLVLARRCLLAASVVLALLVGAGLALAGVDGDGNPDAVFANGAGFIRNRVCLGDGLGGFTCSDVSSDTNNTFDVALGTVDGDNNLDAVFANFQQRNRLCLGDGAGGFTCSDVSSDTNGTEGVALGFVDGDSNPDAVFANGGSPCPAGCINRVCLGDGAGGFTCSNVSSDGNNTFGVALGRVDGDNNLDAVFANVVASQRNRVCLGDGLGGFTCSDVGSDTTVTQGVALGHVDGDNNLDAVFPNYNARNRVCLGDG